MHRSPLEISPKVLNTKVTTQMSSPLLEARNRISGHRA